MLLPLRYGRERGEGTGQICNQLINCNYSNRSGHFNGYHDSLIANPLYEADAITNRPVTPYCHRHHCFIMNPFHLYLQAHSSPLSPLPLPPPPSVINIIPPRQSTIPVIADLSTAHNLTHHNLAPSYTSTHCSIHLPLPPS